MTTNIKKVIAEDQAQANNIALDRTVHTIVAGTLTLTSASPSQLILTGSTAGQIVQLPNATTLTNGLMYFFWNTSSQSIAIQFNDTSAFFTMQPQETAVVALQDNGTSNGTWVRMRSATTSTGGTMPIYFGVAGDLGNAYAPPAAGSGAGSDINTDGFPRPVKIVGYFLGVDPATSGRLFKVHLRRIADLVTNKYTIDKNAVGSSLYLWDNNGLTTYAAGQRPAIYVEKNPDNARAMKLTLWYVWDD